MSDLTDMVLAEVREVGPVTVAQIVDGIGVSETTVRTALKRLEKAGLVGSDNYQLPARVWIAEEPVK